MLRDVLVASIERGQFLFALVGLIAVIMVIKMPPADVSKLVFRLVESFENGKILGYALAVVFAMGWFWHARWQRRLVTNEIHRIGQVRSDLQRQALGKKLKSSGRRT